ncbi:hypothetical protein ACQKKK_10190 [Peribacillus sp. NPDC006672]|uniref:hypothetical protein n=1 Tax=Peribacillus sp. NPDC006672 TaxID=3390606 RepID=UPI003D04E88D
MNKTDLVNTVATQEKGMLPDCIIRGFSGLFRFYKVHEVKGRYIGKSFEADIKTIEFFKEQWLGYERGEIPLRQLIESTLSNQYLWGKDLSDIPNLGNEICQYLEGIERLKLSVVGLVKVDE